MTFSQANDVTQMQTPKVADMGVRSWTIESPASGSGIWTEAPGVLSGQEYYQRLRANVGLYELLRVLYGSVQIVIGTLLARRQGELIDLVAFRCLDDSRTDLVFYKRKSGVMGLREKLSRPIPPVAVELIGVIERLQKGLMERGS